MDPLQLSTLPNCKSSCAPPPPATKANKQANKQNRKLINTLAYLHQRRFFGCEACVFFFFFHASTNFSRKAHIRVLPLSMSRLSFSLPLFPLPLPLIFNGDKFVFSQCAEYREFQRLQEPFELLLHISSVAQKSCRLPVTVRSHDNTHDK